MKVAVTLNLDFPEFFTLMSAAELRDVLYSEIQNALVSAHLEIAMDMVVDAANTIVPDEAENIAHVKRLHAAVEHHKSMAYAIKNATMEVIR